jgi:hypothetical protein
MLVAARRGSQAASQQAASQHEEAMRALVEQAMKGKEQQRQLASWRRYIRKRRQAVAAADATLAGARSLIDVLAQHVRASVGDELLSLAAARVRAGSSSREPEPEPEEASGYWSRSGRVEIDGEPRQLQLRGEVLQIYAAPSGALLDIVRLVDVTEFTRTDSNSRRVVRLESRDAAQSFVASVPSAQEAAEWERAIQHNKAALERTAAARLAASRDRRKCIELEGSAAMEAAAATISERIEDHRVSRAEELSSVARARDAVIDAVLEQQVLTSAHRGNQQASDKEEDRTLDTLLLCAGTSLSAAFSQSDEAALSRQLRRCRGCSQEFIGVATRLQQQPQAQQQPWAEAVRELRRLADADTPTAMLSVVTDTIRAIYRTVNDQTEASKCSATSSAAAKSTQTKSASVAQATATATGAPSPAVVAASVGADELMPIVIYVLIKAQVDGLGARLNFVEKLCNQTIIFSEAGYYFNTLAAALSFLQRCANPPFIYSTYLDRSICLSGYAQHDSEWSVSFWDMHSRLKLPRLAKDTRRCCNVYSRTEGKQSNLFCACELDRLEPPCETDPPSALEPEQEAAWGAVGLKIPQRPAAASVKVGGGSDTCEDDDDGSASSKLPSHHSRTTETELCPLEAADQEEEDDEDEQQAAAHDNSCSSGQRHSGRRGGSKMSAGGGGSSQQQVAQLAAVSRAHVWKRAKLRFGSVAGKANTAFLRQFTISSRLKVIFLPRQARDKHREKTQQKWRYP